MVVVAAELAVDRRIPAEELYQTAVRVHTHAHTRTRTRIRNNITHNPRSISYHRTNSPVSRLWERTHCAHNTYLLLCWCARAKTEQPLC